MPSGTSLSGGICQKFDLEKAIKNELFSENILCLHYSRSALSQSGKNTSAVRETLHNGGPKIYSAVMVRVVSEWSSIGPP